MWFQDIEDYYIKFTDIYTKNVSNQDAKKKDIVLITNTSLFIHCLLNCEAHKWGRQK